MTEDDLIARFFAPLAGPAGLGLKDDAACLVPPPGCDLVVTVDALVAGVHFFPDDPPASIAIKALGVNLSDLAAKGADPVAYLLTLALPGEPDEAFLAAFAAGLEKAAEATGIRLIGGDTVRTPGPLTISVTAFGSVPSGLMVPRTGARPGDILAVTGTIGDAALGLRLRSDAAASARLAAADRMFLLDRYLHPRPRNSLAPHLRKAANAGMDVSDGLVGDCAKMLRASGVTGVIDLGHVPFSKAAESLVEETSWFESAVTGGDDYELLLAVPPENWDVLREEALRSGIPLAPIGRVEEGEAPLRLLRKGDPIALSRTSYSHF